MMAPVVGSGAWPAWMPRVAKTRRLLWFWAMRRFACASAHAAAQVVDEVDAGDEADELAVLLEHGDMVLGEDRQQVAERRVGSDGLDLAHHGAAHRLAESLRVGVGGDEQIRFVDDADKPLAGEHRELRHFVELHAAMDGGERLLGRHGADAAPGVAAGGGVTQLASLTPC